MAFVLDCSVALAWLLPDEQSKQADAWADRLQHDTALVPAIWGLEVSNALLTAVRRKRIRRSDMDQAIEFLGALPIEIDALAALHDVLLLAHQSGLTTYDASYLELARRRGVPLATLDAQLHKAGLKLGLPQQ